MTQCVRAFRSIVYLVGLCGLAAFANTAEATIWTGLSGGSWHAPSNWDAGVPNAGADALFVDRDFFTIDLQGTNATADTLSLRGSRDMVFSANPGVTLTVGDIDLVDSNGTRSTTGGNNNNSFAATFDVDVIVSGTIFEGRKSRGTHSFLRNLTVGQEMHTHAHNWAFGDGVGNDTFTFSGGLNVTFDTILSGDFLNVYVKGNVVTPQITIGDIGNYYAQADGALGDSATNFDVFDGGKLIVETSQATGGSVNITTGSGGAFSGTADGYAIFDAPNINLTDLKINTPFAASSTGAEISGGSSVIVNGTLSGAGAWGGAGTLNVAGTVSPGNSIATITGTNLNLQSGATYDFEIQDPDSTPGIGWDLIAVDSLTFDGDWTLNILDLGLTRDIDPTEEFVIATMNSNDFDPAGATVLAPTDWYVGDDPLFIDANGNLVLTNISNVAQAAVPEPATLSIWCLLGLLAVRLQRKARRK